MDFDHAFLECPPRRARGIDRPAPLDRRALAAQGRGRKAPIISPRRQTVASTTACCQAQLLKAGWAAAPRRRKLEMPAVRDLLQRQSGKYDAADLEDRYETRMRAMIDAKLKGEGIDTSEPEVPERTNVVDLMAALKKSLGQAPDEKNRAPTRKKAAAKAAAISPPQAASAKRKRA